ncbi:hypothetical protein BC628DRAFT_816489 [Trametes gibbosa]|nr:hypothetical protein BC628DRAFT_816489 [Trametes gibbosa]
MSRARASLPVQPPFVHADIDSFISPPNLPSKQSTETLHNMNVFVAPPMHRIQKIFFSHRSDLVPVPRAYRRPPSHTIIAIHSGNQQRCRRARERERERERERKNEICTTSVVPGQPWQRIVRDVAVTIMTVRGRAGERRRQAQEPYWSHKWNS